MISVWWLVAAGAAAYVVCGAAAARKACEGEWEASHVELGLQGLLVAAAWPVVLVLWLAGKALIKGRTE